jgi:hypothetical protein
MDVLVYDANGTGCVNCGKWVAPWCQVCFLRWRVAGWLVHWNIRVCV